MRAASRLTWLCLAAACSERGAPVTSAPRNLAAPPPALRLPDDACLRRGVEQYPEDREGYQAAGGCRLNDELHPTGRWCIANLDGLGAAEVEWSGCYRQTGTTFTLDHAYLHGELTQRVFYFDSAQCWIIDRNAWAAAPAAVRSFVTTAAACTRLCDDPPFGPLPRRCQP